MAPKLSILCVSRGHDYAISFIRNMASLALTLGAQYVIVADGDVAFEKLSSSVHATITCAKGSKGYLESMLEGALKWCTGDYVLRLDDDEQCSKAMQEWLGDKAYETHEMWKFATANMWSLTHFPVNPPLWMDEHTRLTVRAKAGGRHTPHAGSPFGGGELAPVVLEHHKFLVKSFEERKKIAMGYDKFQFGYGTSDGMRPFSLPETCYKELILAPLGDGILRSYDATELRVEKI